jgi:hypothetical protein
MIGGTITGGGYLATHTMWSLAFTMPLAVIAGFVYGYIVTVKEHIS